MKQVEPPPKLSVAKRNVTCEFTMDGQRLGVRAQPPRAGAHSQALLAQLGYSADEIASLRAAHAVA